MATKSMSYDHPTYTCRHVAPLNLPAVAASVSAGKFLALVDMKIKQVNIVMNIVGTNDSAGYGIYNGTTSVGAITMGTSSVGHIGTAYATDISISAGSFLDIRTLANSATLSCSAAIEYEVTPGATVLA